MKKEFRNYFYLIIIFVVVFLSIGFAALQNNLAIENIGANIKIDKDIRITNVRVLESQAAISNYNEYNVSDVSSSLRFNNNDGYLIYEVEIYNLGNVIMGIRDITIDNNNLEYELLDYKLKDKLCDSECTLGVKKTIKIKVSLKDGGNLNTDIPFNLKFAFGQIFTVTYYDINNSQNLPQEVIENDSLDVNIVNTSDNVLNVSMDNKILVSPDDYTYINDNLIIKKVTGNIKIYFKMPICQRATMLHQEECLGSYCKGLGTTIGNKNIISYGSLGTLGTLESGNAFDCDVNGDGVYDATKERFYYLFDTSSDVALLIYYSNVTLGEPSKNTYKYDESGENWNGPVSAILQLPTKKQWSNVHLINEKRAIINEYGTNKLKDGHSLPSAFNYEKYAARLLSFNELKQLAGIYIPTWQNGELNNHLYLAENTNFTTKNTSNFDGFWLETPRFTPASYAWFFYATARRVHSSPANKDGILGVRPVIEVYKSDISY